MFVHALLAAAALPADVWLTLHGPRNELWLPWPRVSHPPAQTFSSIVSHVCHACSVTAQLTRLSAGPPFIISPGGKQFFRELADAASAKPVRYHL